MLKQKMEMLVNILVSINEKEKRKYLSFKTSICKCRQCIHAL